MGGGRSGGLKGHGDRTGQEASRAAPVPGPTAEQGARAAMADPGTRVAMAEQGARAAMADPGTREAMADQGTREAMADRGARAVMTDLGTREAMADRGAWVAMVGPPLRQEPYNPPKKIPWGK